MILTTVLILGLATSQPTSAAQPEPFFGEDKVKHFVTSFVIGSLATSGLRAAGVGRHESIAAGAGISVVAGVAKEIHDRRRGQFFSVRDLLWDIAGAGGSALLMNQTR